MTGPLAELARRAAGRPLVVIDDDPTGTQTLRDVTVMTAWDAKSVARHLDETVVFLSTNSRSLDEPAAESITRHAAVAAVRASKIAGVAISIVSRSDSTLRGHFPLEVAAIVDALDRPDARVLLAPYFGEGGRVTVGDVHFLERNGMRVPVAETEFARDDVFGYRSSNLRDWVAEKHAGRAVPEIVSLTLDLVRGEGGPRAVAKAIRDLPPGGVVIANAETDADIETVALGALIAEEDGVPVVARAAASYVRARAGRGPAPLLGTTEVPAGGAGLVIIGSHVPTTTRQLEHLLGSGVLGDVLVHELPVGPLASGDPGAERLVSEAASAVDAALASGRTAIIATERERADIGLAGARAVSRGLAGIVGRLMGRPGWVLSKGGITSYDVAALGLDMQEARVAGQLLPGVPVWVGGSASRWPRLPLVVFPGNVGAPDALARAVAALVTP